MGLSVVDSEGLPLSECSCDSDDDALSEGLADIERDGVIVAETETEGLTDREKVLDTVKVVESVKDDEPDALRVHDGLGLGVVERESLGESLTLTLNDDEMVGVGGGVMVSLADDVSEGLLESDMDDVRNCDGEWDAESECD